MLKLVYACLAFSFIALVALVIAATGPNHSFRGTTKPMFDALTQGATILAADRNGAVTQTGNGRVAGYKRGAQGDEWTLKFDPFGLTSDDPWGDDVIGASAWCAGGCPAALVLVGDRFSARGGADPALAQAFNAKGASGLQVLAVTARDTAFGHIGTQQNTAAPLLRFKGSLVTTLPARAPSVVMVDDDGGRLAAGSPNGAIGTLTRLERVGGKWVHATPNVDEPNLRNLCISHDGRWVGAISAQTLLMGFGDYAPLATGNPVAGGTCTADSAGFTAVVNPAARATSVAAARYTHDGRRVWARTFGSQRLLSPTGSPLIVTSTSGGDVTAIDAVSGKVEMQKQLATQPFVTSDGAIITAGRDGVPVWLYVPGISDR